jgi:hypothetical protein
MPRTYSLTLSDIITQNDEPRVLDIRLAEALEFERPRNIRKLIHRHATVLARFGATETWVERVSLHRGAKPLGGRPAAGFLLNRKQALYIVAKSETAKAAEITIQMVEVFDAWLSGERGPAPALPPRGELRILDRDVPYRLVEGEPHLVLFILCYAFRIEKLAAREYMRAHPEIFGGFGKIMNGPNGGPAMVVNVEEAIALAERFRPRALECLKPLGLAGSRHCLGS